MNKMLFRFARAATQRKAIDALFEQVGELHLFDSGWINGRVIVSAEEAAAIRNALYVTSLLPLVTSVPMLYFLAVFSYTTLTVRDGIPGLVTYAFALLTGVIISVGFALKYVYMAAVVQDKPRYQPASDRINLP